MESGRQLYIDIYQETKINNDPDTIRKEQYNNER